jgi:coenzyme F420-reducing hydrogenase gamma subunit
MLDLKIRMERGTTELTAGVKGKHVCVNIGYVKLRDCCGCYLTLAMAKRLRDWLNEWIEQREVK